jgi:hypothetical protein
MLPRTSPVEGVAESELIVVGIVESRQDTDIVVRPEVFLKGPASAEPLRFSGPNNTDCAPAPVEPRDRVLVYVYDAQNVHLPLYNDVYFLKDGHAIMGDEVRTEVEVVSAIRAVTGQYAVPAASSSEGAGIDWGHTVIPLGAALAVIFVIGLVLMRVWHRIDPS